MASVTAAETKPCTSISRSVAMTLEMSLGVQLFNCCLNLSVAKLQKNPSRIGEQRNGNLFCLEKFRKKISCVDWQLQRHFYIVNTHIVNTHIVNSHIVNTHIVNTHIVNIHTVNTHTVNTHTVNTHIVNTGRYICIVNIGTYCQHVGSYILSTFILSAYIYGQNFCLHSYCQQNFCQQSFCQHTSFGHYFCRRIILPTLCTLFIFIVLTPLYLQSFLSFFFFPSFANLWREHQLQRHLLPERGLPCCLQGSIL
jgi:hypothetical protein